MKSWVPWWSSNEKASEGLAALGDAVFGLGDDPREGEVATRQLVQVLQIGQGGVAEVLDLQAVIVQGVTAQVEADHFLLVVQLFQRAPTFDGGRVGSGIPAASSASPNMFTCALSAPSWCC
jgi:hypothetical protein